MPAYDQLLGVGLVDQRVFDSFLVHVSERVENVSSRCYGLYMAMEEQDVSSWLLWFDFYIRLTRLDPGKQEPDKALETFVAGEFLLLIEERFPTNIDLLGDKLRCVNQNGILPLKTPFTRAWTTMLNNRQKMG